MEYPTYGRVKLAQSDKVSISFLSDLTDDATVWLEVGVKGSGAMARHYVASGSSFERDIGYARAVVDGDWIFVSGTTGFDYMAGTISEDVVAQCERALDNIETALREVGFALADVVRVRYILPDAADFEPCWPMLRARFGPVRPAATMLAAGLADPRMKIEIEVTGRRSR